MLPKGRQNGHIWTLSDLAKLIGDTTPTLPYIPPPPRAGCNAVAMVVMIAITVVATVATAGAAAAAMGSAGLSSFSMALGVQTLAHGSVMAAAAGGFVGSVAGQLAGKAMGVVDSFSLKNALASGLTAGATAGMGNILGAGQTFQGAQAAQEASKAGMLGRFATVAKDATVSSLNIYGKMALAASATAFNVAANKLAGNHQASFQWRNVVSSTATAGAMHGMGVTNTGLALERFAGNEALLGGTLHGIVGAAIGYGVNKGLYNQGSWNFRNVATDAFGNALGNSIVKGLSSERTLSAKEQAELDQKVAAVGRKELAKLDAKTRLQLQQSTDAIATDVGTRLASDGAAGFDALTDVLQQRNDAMMDHYRDKRADAAAKNGGMWQQTKADIAAIDATVAANKQQRAVQAAQIQQRYANRAIDFRMANPTYRRPEPLFSYDSALAADNAMWGAGKQRAQGFRDGIAAGVDLIERSANAYGRAFEKTYDRFNQIMNKGFDSFIDQPADGVRTITDAYSLSGGYSTFTFGGEIVFAFQSDGKVAVGLAGAPTGIKVDTGRGLEFGVTRLHWQPGVKPADAESILGGWGTTGGLMINTPIGSFGRVESVSWDDKPFSSPKAVVASGWSYNTSLLPKVDSVVNLPVTPVANVSYGIQVPHTSTVDLGWFGKLLYWGRQ